MTAAGRKYTAAPGAALDVVSAEFNRARRGRSGNPLVGNCGAFFFCSAPVTAVRPLGARPRRLLCVGLSCFGVALSRPRCPSSVGALAVAPPCVAGVSVSGKKSMRALFPPYPLVRAFCRFRARGGTRPKVTAVSKKGLFVLFSFARAGS